MTFRTPHSLVESFRFGVACRTLPFGVCLGLVLLGGFVTGCTATDVVARAPCNTDRDCGDSPCLGGTCTPPVNVCDRPFSQVGLAADPPRVGCGGGLAETAFRFALCACDGLATDFPVQSDTYDSREGLAFSAGGSVGANGRVAATDTVDVGGSLWVRNGAGMALGVAGATIAQDLRVGGDLTGTAVTVAGNAFVAGRIQLSQLDVSGTLTQPIGATLDVTNANLGAQVASSVDVPEVCSCDPSTFVDVSALVEGRRTENDNAAIGLDARVLDSFDSPRTLTLPCGSFYLDRVFGTAPVSIVATGAAALFIRGDLVLNESLEVRVEGTGTLDLFVSGSVTTRPGLRVGSRESASRVRLYLGGEGTLFFGADSEIGAHVYAPRTELVTDGAFAVYGSAFVRRLAAGGPLTLHYDRAILEAGADCPDAPAACDSCLDCRNQACIGGRCGACGDDADCCPPLSCISGSCQARLL